MKICSVMPEDLPVPPVRGGSVQIYIDTLLHQFAADQRRERNGMQSTLSSTSKVPEFVLLSPDKTRPSGWTKPYDQAIGHFTIQAASKQDYHRQVINLLQTMRPDIIQVENRPLFASDIRKKIHRPTISNLYSNTFLGPRHIPRGKVRKTLESVDSVVLISHYLQNLIVKKYKMKQSTWKPTVIYPGIDTTVFPMSRRFVSAFSPERPLRVLFVGRVIRQKGVQVLVEAVKHLVDAGYPVSLTIVGKTHPWEQKYDNLVKQSATGYPITFTGFVPPQELPRHYAQHDLFVCPSQQREAFGLVNLEAMSSGLAVIGSRVGGISEIMKDGSGILVDAPAKAESFRAAIAYFLQHPERLRQMSLRARERAEQFTWNRTARQYIDLYEALMGDSPP